jgi:outer membrane lipopolysaccharide assembly protein LptE/RlpB
MAPVYQGHAASTEAAPRGRDRLCDNKGRMPALLSKRCLLLVCAAPAALALALTGCGYHTAGAATHIPANVQTIDVPIFKNHTQSYHVEVAMTQAVLKELQSRTAFKTESNEDLGDADAVLRGVVTGFTVYALTYDSTTSQSSSYEITITAAVTLTDRDGRVLYSNKRYVFRQQYESTQDLVSFLQEDQAAVTRLSRDFAQSLVADMTESF